MAIFQFGFHEAEALVIDTPDSRGILVSPSIQRCHRTEEMHLSQLCKQAHQDIIDVPRSQVTRGMHPRSCQVEQRHILPEVTTQEA